jgi:uncharacterized protein YoxC
VDNGALQDMRAKVESLDRLAQEVYQASEEFPSVNRNTKRIMASIQMLKLNLEEPE